LLLHKADNGLYGAVENYNSGCPVFYEVSGGKVAFGGKADAVAVDALKDHLGTPAKDNKD
jgi:hypothetical protein